LDPELASARLPVSFRATIAFGTHLKANLPSAADFPLPSLLYVIMNSVLSLTGAAHRYRRRDFAAEIRVGER
jgi:hypothetical protein